MRRIDIDDIDGMPYRNIECIIGINHIDFPAHSAERLLNGGAIGDPIIYITGHEVQAEHISRIQGENKTGDWYTVQIDSIRWRWSANQNVPRGWHHIDISTD